MFKVFFGLIYKEEKIGGLSSVEPFTKDNRPNQIEDQNKQEFNLLFTPSEIKLVTLVNKLSNQS